MKPMLIAFDFDGTLAEIRPDPREVEMYRGASPLLAELAALPGVVAAIVSGRDAADLERRVDVPDLYLIASHGLEIHGPGGVLIRDTPPLDAQLDPELFREIEMSGLRLEWKKHGVTLHWRGIPLEAVDPVIAMFRDWAQAAGLDVVEGRCVVEARVRGGGKEQALRWLAHAIGASRIIYAGDDFTDFGALRFAAESGRAFFIASSEREPPAGVTVVASFRDLFRLVREEAMI